MKKSVLILVVVLLVGAAAFAGEPDVSVLVDWMTGSFSSAELEVREGCTVFLHPDGEDRFVGGTRDRDCGSGLRGAAYATSEVIVSDGRIESWDRGFDDEGTQVWGAEKGAYVFLRTDEDSK